MEICLGMIGMQPTEFWNCSVQEVHCAVDGFLEFNGGEQELPMERDELKELMELNPD
tara:strand:+ start:268 stop:438 length:171 start_codon:yes stop_codon:yes gene_type:complete